MNELLKCLTEQKQEWQKCLRLAEKRLAHAPEGSVKVKTSRGKYHQYFYTDQNHAAANRYVGKEFLPQIRRIIQRDYDRKVKKYLEKRLSLLNALVCLCENDSLNDLYEKLPPARKDLVRPVLKPDSEFVEEWLNSHISSANPFPIPNGILTNKGENVRSKSEKIIADKLNDMNIPYIYESPLTLPGLGTIYPDFTVLNVSLRKTIYFEHFGKMDDPEYLQKALRKIAAYNNSHRWFGDGLLYTFESAGTPPDTAMLEKMIRKYLL